jgi:hypothetical protein
VAQLRAQLGPVDLETFDSYMADSQKTNSWIVELIERSPFTVKVKSLAVARHRRGDCRCPR